MSSDFPPPFSPLFHKDISLEQEHDDFMILSASKGEFPVGLGYEQVDTLSTLDGLQDIDNEFENDKLKNSENGDAAALGMGTESAAQQGSLLDRRQNHKHLEQQSSVFRYFAQSADSWNSEKIMEDYFSRLLHGIDQLLCTASHLSLSKLLYPFLVFKMDESGPLYTSLNNPSDKSSIVGSSSQNTTPASTHKVTLESYMTALSQPLLTATKTGAPAQIGHMSSSLPFFHRVLAKVIVGLNQNVVKVETSASFTGMEREVIRGMHFDFWARPKEFYDTFGDSGEYCLGIACSGGTLANLTALWVARNQCLAPRNNFAGVAKEGLAAGLLEYGYSGACVIGSRMMHYSFRKGVDLLGLGEAGLRIVNTDDQFRVKVDGVRAMIAKCKQENILVIAIIGICGTTETGSIDPLYALGTLAAANNIYFHVDAAWGGPLLYSPAHASKLHGIETAQSVTIDGHKQLYTPMGLGLVLFKEAVAAKSIEKSASYVIRATSMDLGKFGIEGSRPANILYLHASLSLLGRNGIGILVERGCALVRQLRNRLLDWPSAAWHILHQPMSNILLFRYIPTNLRFDANRSIRAKEIEEVDEFQEHVQELNWYVEKMQGLASGIQDNRPHAFTSRTTVMYKGTINCAAFRVVIANPRTGWRHIVHGMQELERIGLKCERQREIEGIMDRLGREVGVDDYRKISGWPFEI